MLKVDAVTGKVSAPYNFVGNLEGTATNVSTLTVLSGQDYVASDPTASGVRTTKIANGLAIYSGYPI